MTNKVDTRKEWEKEWERKFTAFGNVYADKGELKAFIQQTIDQEVNKALEEFAKKVEEKVIGNLLDSYEEWTNYICNFPGSSKDRYKLSFEQWLERKQRQALKLLVKPTK
jgi:hypothetical protein